MFTVAKREFLSTFGELILRPRDLDYRVQFPGPAGTNAVEAALKLARKVTGRTEVVYFTNAFHGMTLGALAVTSSAKHRDAGGIPLRHARQLTYGERFFDRALEGNGSGPVQPAAVIVEAVQGEGGVNVARPEWLRELAGWCRRHRAPLILDDVQMGCGRTGPFFSFEAAGIEPDMVCLSKSLSGYGLPLALTLIRPDLDVWRPGEHNGTFRGFNPALVTATAALETYWSDDALERSTLAKARRIEAALGWLADAHGRDELEVRVAGMVHGLAFANGELAGRVVSEAFDRGLLVETAGPEGEVVKLLPPLTITDDELEHGLAVLAAAVDTAW
jgi:diaminobutyrate-2-oxoglutarate transaminase